MKEEKMNYETPELEVLGVETQNCFASGVDSPRALSSLNGYDEEWD